MTYWKTIARSCRGIAHEQQGLPCQDAADCRVLPNGVVVGAVADGAGSARLSDVGAQRSVDLVLQGLSLIVQEFEQRHPGKVFPVLSESVARQVFTQLHHCLMAELAMIAQAHQCEVKDLACTLLAFLATPQGLAAMQIGDGFMVVRLPDDAYGLVFEPDKGEYSNETTFVTSTDAVEAMQVRVLAETPVFVCLASDGLERVALRVRDWLPYPPFFQPLEEYLSETDAAEPPPDYLEAFLASAQLNARTSDDKTLLLAQLVR
ncbi:MAG: protein phosphatase 2C domain-containing protein [Leptolyngbya sp. DLM2.Bin15]|nr:MAG: protein phosphatase 2C domain-containing protein [Leptolyngbya sp. DLM2.Bin15]